MPTVHFGRRPGRTRGRPEDRATADGSVTSVVLGLGGSTVLPEKQTVDCDATGGTFTLTQGVNESGDIAHDATIGTMETAIEAMTGVTSATVTGTAGGPWLVQFNDGLGALDLMVPDNFNLTGETEGATVVLTQQGIAAANETQLIVRDGDTGSFTLSYGGQTTGSLDETTTAGQLETALELLSTITGVTVTGSGTRKDPFVILFVDPTGDATMITSTVTSFSNTVVVAARAQGAAGDRE